MSTQTESSQGGIGLGGAIFIVFLVLKLGVGHTGVQDWSWWWVTSPLWIPIAIVVGTMAILGAVVGLIALFTPKATRKRNRNNREAANALRNYGKNFHR